MAAFVSIGESNFRNLREAGTYYVDKTEIIYELVENTKDTVSLFTRPRRFGKTLMMSMFRDFFDIKRDSRKDFEGLKITEHQEFSEKWMNKYPVIFATFKEAESIHFDVAYDKLKGSISDICLDMAEDVKKSQINEVDRNVFDRLMSCTESDAELQKSLKILSRILYHIYGRKVIIIIDEYDVPLANAQEMDDGENGFYRSMLDVIRGIMSNALKDNEYLEFAVITGCLRISKESVFTGTNNFASYSALDERFSSYFGFTDDEVHTMLEAAGFADAYDTIREWYDGYVFGSSYVYCPWDVTRYISDLAYDPKTPPQNYWKNTSHNSVLLSFAKRTDFNVKGKFERLLNGGTVEQTITDVMTYDAMHESEDNLWSVLLMTGYVTKADPNERGDTVHLKIPNREVKSIFEDTVVRLFRETLDTSTQRELMAALWNGDAKKAEEIISGLLFQTISYNDYHEDYYHAFLAGLFVGIGYEVESNREHGIGRTDIVIFDSKNRRAMIIEAKRSVKESDMEKDCKAATDQILREKYAKSLTGYRQIRCYGIAFFQKDAKVMELKS